MLLICQNISQKKYMSVLILHDTLPKRTMLIRDNTLQMQCVILQTSCAKQVVKPISQRRCYIDSCTFTRKDTDHNTCYLGDLAVSCAQKFALDRDRNSSRHAAQLLSLSGDDVSASLAIASPA